MAIQFALAHPDRVPPIAHVMQWDIFPFRLEANGRSQEFGFIDVNGEVCDFEFAPLLNVMVTFHDGSQSLTNRCGLVAYCDRSGQRLNLEAELVEFEPF